MNQPLPNQLPPAPLAPQEIPDSFFSDLAASGRPSEGRELLTNLGHPVAPGTWQPQKVLPWYDAIIDDMFANPGCTMKETAARLSRSPVTIGLICRSDLFKARYSQRRAQYNEEIQHRLTGKLVKVAEAALEHTLTALGKKKDSVPLALLSEITSDALDRLGYGIAAKQQPANGLGVTVNVQANAAATAEVQVTPEALASARDKLRLVEGRNSLRMLPEEAPALLDGAGEGKTIDGDLGAL